MKKHKLIIAVIVFLFLGLQKTQAQVSLEKGVETFKINKAEVVDNTILTILDSAFTFLRLPPLGNGSQYYYSLHIEKPKDTLLKNYVDICNVTLEVNSYLFIVQDKEAFDWFDEQEKALITFKGVDIIVFFSKNEIGGQIHKYIKPITEKYNFFYNYLKKNGKPRTLYSTSVLYEQKVNFLVKRKYFRFKGYELNITNVDDLSTH